MPTLTAPNATRWWLEWEFFLVLAVLAVSYFPRLSTFPVRGEESRRARVAFELIDLNDWVVPREQGDPFLSRPPFQNWLIALSSKLIGNRSALAIRLPSVLATFALVAVIYGYCRHFVGSVGSLTAALAFFSGGEMLKTGRSAETEAIYVFLISTSLLLWHLGHSQRWNRWVTWFIPYCLAACACLTKGGLQPPVYLLGATSVYLLLTGKWKEFFSISHFLSAGIGAGIVGTWYWGCARRIGWETTSSIWMSDTSSRFAGWKITEVLQHMGSFPVETIGCLMPWLPVLLAFCWAPWRDSLKAARPAVMFCSAAAVIAFLTIWIPPNGATRYFMPLYPCVAVLVGIAIDRCQGAPPSLPSHRLLRIWAMVIAICFLLTAASVPIAAITMNHGRTASYVPSFPHALFYALSLIAIGLLVLRSRGLDSPQHSLSVVVGIALGAAVISNGIIDDVRIKRSPDTAGAVSRAKDQLPSGVRLISFGHVYHLFAYYYDTFIPPKPRSPNPQDVAPGEYFCFNWQSRWPPKIPFGWAEIARIKVNRFDDEESAKWVIIARRAAAS